MSQQKIDVKALGLIWNEDKILVSEAFDKIKNEIFYRPIGGKIEFGETGRDALAREFLEELSVEIEVVNQVGFLENLFSFDGIPGHEYIVFYEAKLKNRTEYEKKEFDGIDGVGGFKAYWMPITVLKRGEKILYPAGLIGLLSDLPR